MNNSALMLIGALMALILVGAGLRGRRLPRRTLILFAIAWVAIIVAAALVIQALGAGR